MSLILFEDDRVGQLYPITVGRAAFHIACGSFRLWDIACQVGPPVRYCVRPHLRAVLEAETAAATLPSRNGAGPTLLLNARVVPQASLVPRLRRWLGEETPGMVRCGTAVAAALLPPDTPPPAERAGPEELAAYLERLDLPAADLDLPLFEYPHDVVRQHLAILRENLESRIGSGGYREVADGVFAALGARLGQYVVTDTSSGPIVLEANAAVGPFSYLSGPVHVGARARVLEHAAIKDRVALGHTTKIGGEVEASIIEAFTNKQHHGFLGHSYLGSWVNLGAGTCNSDLKNTYGQVNMEYGGRKTPTGMQFIGAIVGDYAKTAINTSIFTGKTIGVCSMIYGFVTTNVPSFVNYARLFGQVTEAPVQVVVAAQARMFARRQVPQRPCDVQLLADMYRLTAHERQLAGEPLAF